MKLLSTSSRNASNSSTKKFDKTSSSSSSSSIAPPDYEEISLNDESSPRQKSSVNMKRSSSFDKPIHRSSSMDMVSSYSCHSQRLPQRKAELFSSNNSSSNATTRDITTTMPDSSSSKQFSGIKRIAHRRKDSNNDLSSSMHSIGSRRGIPQRRSSMNGTTTTTSGSNHSVGSRLKPIRSSSRRNLFKRGGSTRSLATGSQHDKQGDSSKATTTTSSSSKSSTKKSWSSLFKFKGSKNKSSSNETKRVRRSRPPVKPTKSFVMVEEKENFLLQLLVKQSPKMPSFDDYGDAIVQFVRDVYRIVCSTVSLLLLILQPMLVVLWVLLQAPLFFVTKIPASLPLSSSEDSSSSEGEEEEEEEEGRDRLYGNKDNIDTSDDSDAQSIDSFAADDDDNCGAEAISSSLDNNEIERRIKAAKTARAARLGLTSQETSWSVTKELYNTYESQFVPQK